MINITKLNVGRKKKLSSYNQKTNYVNPKPLEQFLSMLKQVSKQKDIDSPHSSYSSPSKKIKKQLDASENYQTLNHSPNIKKFKYRNANYLTASNGFYQQNKSSKSISILYYYFP